MGNGNVVVTIVVCGIIGLICVFAVMHYRKVMAQGCCGTGDREKVKKVRVKDKNPAHYPFQYRLAIDGMVCSACASKVEASINGLEGVWAKVDLSGKSALVRSKGPLEEAEIREKVNGLGGYTVMGVENVTASE